jgi:hypothetical protein
VLSLSPLRNPNLFLRRSEIARGREGVQENCKTIKKIVNIAVSALIFASVCYLYKCALKEGACSLLPRPDDASEILRAIWTLFNS